MIQLPVIPPIGATAVDFSGLRISLVRYCIEPFVQQSLPPSYSPRVWAVYSSMTVLVLLRNIGVPARDSPGFPARDIAYTTQ
jgi:hypothetical protein